jgi:type I restriction enzyme S subunit
VSVSRIKKPRSRQAGTARAEADVWSAAGSESATPLYDGGSTPKSAVASRQGLPLPAHADTFAGLGQAPGELPVGWIQCALQDVGDIVSGGTPSTKNPEFWGDEVPWISPSDLTGYSNKFIGRGAKSLTKLGLKKSSAKVMPEGSVHFSSRAPIGYVVISSQSLCTNQGFKSLVPAPGIFNEYIYFYLKSIRDLANSLATGTTFKELSGSAFAKLPIPLPPLAEQKRIVAKIEELFSELDAGEESLRRARRQLGVYRQSLLKQAFEGKLTAKWRSQTSKVSLTAPERSDRSVLSADFFPADWLSLLLGDVADVTGGLTKNAKREALLQRMAYLRVANVYANELRLEEIKDIGVTADEFAKVRLQKGDLLIVEGNGSLDQIGRVALWNGSIPVCGHQNHLIRARCHKVANPAFLLFFLLSPQGRGQIVQKAASTSGLHTLSVSKVASLAIPLPSLPEQQEIVRILDEQFEAIGRNEREIDVALKRSEALRQSILKKAFSGRLVPQDPADEPASVLLERIREGREKKGSDRSIGSDQSD